MKILVFDTETTGIPSSKLTLEKQPAIVQFAAVMYVLDDGGVMNEVRKVDILINPKVDIPVETTLIHKITNDMVKDKPEFAKVAQEIKALFLDTDLVVAHNIAFDKKLLEIEFARLGQKLDFWPSEIYDTMLESVNLCRLPSKNRGFKSPRLSELHTFLFNKDFDNAHNALDDVLATGRCLQQMISIGHAEFSPSTQVSLF